MNTGCIGCNQAITQQKAEDQKIIELAHERANQYNTVVGLYRDQSGALCIAPTLAGYPIIMHITPDLQ